MTDIGRVFVDEMRRIFVLRPVFSVLIVGVAIYTVFYPQPYLNEALRDVPIAVVDQDGTSASRELARRVDATPDVAVAMVLADLPNAEREVFKRAVSGVLVIPKYFERDLLHGRPSPIALYADASYFLVYQRLAGGVSAVAQTFGAEVEAARLVDFGVDPNVATAVTAPLQLTAVALFNPQGGYATYLLPAAFVLILQQTLLIATGLLGTLRQTEAEARTLGLPRPGLVASVVGKSLAYLAVEAVILPLYLIVLPYLYGLPRLGSVLSLLGFAVPFVLSVSGLGLVLAAIFRTPLGVQLASAAVGLPFFFLAGFAWPTEAIPSGIRLFSLLVPSTSAIDGFVRISQLGASLHDVRSQFAILWGLTVLYGAIATLLEARRRRMLDLTRSGSGLPAVPTA